MPRTPYDVDIPDLSGQRAVVTGASDGIGLEIAMNSPGRAPTCSCQYETCVKGKLPSPGFAHCTPVRT